MNPCILHKTNSNFSVRSYRNATTTSQKQTKTTVKPLKFNFRQLESTDMCTNTNTFNQDRSDGNDTMGNSRRKTSCYMCQCPWQGSMTYQPAKLGNWSVRQAHCCKAGLMIYLHGVCVRACVRVCVGGCGCVGVGWGVRACVNMFGCVLPGCLCFIFLSGLSESK